mgnify:CR=1 FL=1
MHEGNFHVEISPGIPQGKEWKYPHRKFPFISPEFPQGNHEEISAVMTPWNSPHKSVWKSGGHGWLARLVADTLAGVRSLKCNEVTSAQNPEQ